jgi:hypothetical protein
MDLLFGTYYDPGKEPEQYGITEPVHRSYAAQIVVPFLPSFLTNQILKGRKSD